MNKLYIIEYENAHWCGGAMECVVWAKDEYQAVDRAEHYMEESQRELFSSEYEEEPSEDCAYALIAVNLMEDSEYQEFYKDDVQRKNFYPCVNPEDANLESVWAQYK